MFQAIFPTFKYDLKGTMKNMTKGTGKCDSSGKIHLQLQQICHKHLNFYVIWTLFTILYMPPFQQINLFKEKPWQILAIILHIFLRVKFMMAPNQCEWLNRNTFEFLALSGIGSTSCLYLLFCNAGWMREMHFWKGMEANWSYSSPIWGVELIYSEDFRTK